MRFASVRRPLKHGSVLLFCNLLSLAVLPLASGQTSATESQVPPAQQQAPAPSATTPVAPKVGTFEAGTEKPQDQNVQDQSSPVTPGQPAISPADQHDHNTPDKRPSGLKLGPGDLVDISVYGVPELSTKARVSDKGDLYLPLINYVHVEDLSVEEAQAVIEKRLADGGFVKEPHVSIFVSEYSSQAVSMLGQIARPGLYPLIADRRLFDMITVAGGLTDRASRTITITHRDNPDKLETVELSRNITDKPESNVPVYPGDIIEVQRAPIIYVVGDVNRPSGLLIDNGTLTVLQALALAGGPNRTAKLNDSRILRKSNGPNGMTETKIQLKKMLQAKTPDIPLEANDILFVPNSAAKQLATTSLTTAMAVTASLAVYAVHP